jgi:hypothetical protein
MVIVSPTAGGQFVLKIANSSLGAAHAIDGYCDPTCP